MILLDEGLVRALEPGAAFTGTGAGVTTDAHGVPLLCWEDAGDQRSEPAQTVLRQAFQLAVGTLLVDVTGSDSTPR